MKVHLVGVAGTGMGQLATLLKDAGHEVSGSDVAFDPPMGPALEAAGIRCLPGWKAENVAGDLDLVVVGNAIRRDNVEAVEAERRGIARTSMSAALRERFLTGKRPLVVAGTHGKTTTSAMCAWVLERAGLEPGFFIGGLPKNFDGGARLGGTKRKIVGASAMPAPFVVEGDEYDAVFWHKKPKFFDYVDAESVVIVTSVEHDHIDIYPSADVYEAQFRELVERVGPDGLVVCDARDAAARRIVSAHAKARTAFYALDGDDTGDVTPTWLAVLVPGDEGVTPFDLFLGGSYGGRFALEVPGAHNVRNALATLAACAEGFGVDIEKARATLTSFKGVRRRQDLIGRPNEIAIYDDFAHHPTAVDETLRALRARHPSGKLWAVFEPRSATACRNIHQIEYETAFRAADRVLFAPLGRANIPEAERLDVARIAAAIGEGATAAPSIDAIADTLVREAKPGDVVALLSNGAFGGLHERLLHALGAK
ncbi:MAG: UDP-N-acetylmuramate:L-alanyl-gamma-D-glutamyl-meso-diaminopimelate ligase [Labilithrix sp.]|nr:UDP-N-acetylmuramate:L-alanyl-gamma-D-glutamyl-meso-diaminopimelate ligase [Labilithrix sp.]MCW5818119.1 UDP-N-acetylmuramate:L-alanyl-gamma-D-glutamyl-meso-diaminopimelate ligase [Labilithrix sp.]